MYLDSGLILYSLLILAFIPIIFLFAKKKINFSYFIVLLIFYLYIYKLFEITFLPIPLNAQAIHELSVIHSKDKLINVIPFYDYISHVNKYNLRFMVKQAAMQYGGNILLFVPFGFILPIIKRKIIGFKKILLISLIVSFCIEASQLSVSLLIHTLYRYADIDDIITNVIGALAGFLLFKLFLSFTRKVLSIDFLALFEFHAEKITETEHAIKS